MTSPWGVGQIRMRGLRNALSLPGSSGNYASTPDSAANSITGDIDIRAEIRPSTWSQNAYLVGKAGSGEEPNFSYGFALLSSGLLYAFISGDGTASITDYLSTVTTGFAADSAHFVRWTRVAATGSSAFYTSEDGVAWTQLGDTVTGASGNIFNSTADLEVGRAGSTTTGFFDGHIYTVEIRDGIDGTIVQSFDATAVIKIGTRNPSSVAAGGPWTMNGSAWDWDDA